MRLRVRRRERLRRLRERCRLLMVGEGNGMYDIEKGREELGSMRGISMGWNDNYMILR